MTRSERIKAAWFAAFNDKVLELQPAWAGRICWDTAITLRNLGHTPEQAAQMYAYNRTDSGGARDINAIEQP